VRFTNYDGARYNDVHGLGSYETTGSYVLMPYTARTTYNCGHASHASHSDCDLTGKYTTAGAYGMAAGGDFAHYVTSSLGEQIHPGGGNILFYAGHVKWFKFDNIVSLDRQNTWNFYADNFDNQ